MYFAADAIRTRGRRRSAASSSIFLSLFTFAPAGRRHRGPDPGRVDFVAIVGPLLGLAFAFDAVNGERARGDAAATAVPADLPRRRDQRQVRRRPGGHRARPDVRRRRSSRRSGSSGSGSSPSAEEILRLVVWLDRDVRLHRAVAGLRAAAVGPRPAGGDVGPRRLRRVVPVHDLRRADHADRRRGHRPGHGHARPAGGAASTSSRRSPGSCRTRCTARRRWRSSTRRSRRSRTRRRSAGSTQAAQRDPVAPVVRPEPAARLAAHGHDGRDHRWPSSRSPTSASCARKSARRLFVQWPTEDRPERGVAARGAPAPSGTSSGSGRPARTATRTGGTARIGRRRG